MPDKPRSRPADKSSLPKSPPSPKSKSRKLPMSDTEPSQPNDFEIERIRRLVKLMEEHDLSEVDLRESRQRIRICRGPKEAPRAAYASPPAASMAQSHAAAIAPPAASSAAAEGPNIAVIKSPMIGTFYSRPNPKAEAYVKVGDRVDTTTVVCIIEAMKVFNEIPAETRGQIVAVLVADGEAVDFEKPLFKVDTSK
jgi:acetyl-CoA carboxylase biotin carboxyl carrier protein